MGTIVTIPEFGLLIVKVCALFTKLCTIDWVKTLKG
jgi:hypothetical protein